MTHPAIQEVCPPGEGMPLFLVCARTLSKSHRGCSAVVPTSAAGSCAYPVNHGDGGERDCPVDLAHAMLCGISLTQSRSARVTRLGSIASTSVLLHCGNHCPRVGAKIGRLCLRQPLGRHLR
jgi:hypothetical protein